jgi:uncharacterized protein involved in high-affinity Fe2+ transport
MRRVIGMEIHPRPEVNGFLRHAGHPTGVAEWWNPFSVEFGFTYPKE